MVCTALARFPTTCNDINLFITGQHWSVCSVKIHEKWSKSNKPIKLSQVLAFSWLFYFKFKNSPNYISWITQFWKKQVDNRKLTRKMKNNRQIIQADHWSHKQIWKSFNFYMIWVFSILRESEYDLNYLVISTILRAHKINHVIIV